MQVCNRLGGCLQLIHLRDLTDEQWSDVHRLMFDPRMAEHTGVSAELIAAKPDLVSFYRNIMMAHKADRFQGWAIVRGDDFLGHAILDKSALGEWELSCVLLDPDDWGTGIGVKAALHALNWAFEKDKTQWVYASVRNKDPKVRRILRKGGFREFSNILLMDAPTWESRWQGRV
jgi:RimJ/RimL family protein N-acetyltransferase